MKYHEYPDDKLWERIFLNDHMLKDICESPKTLRIPVGSCVHVRKGQGQAFNSGCYVATPGYATKENSIQLKEITEKHIEGCLIEIGDQLEEGEWNRLWVDEYYPLSSTPVYKCYLPGMVLVTFKILNIDKASESLDKWHYVPACPTCTVEEYENPKFKALFDKATRMFIHYWLYGEQMGED